MRRALKHVRVQSAIAGLLVSYAVALGAIVGVARPALGSAGFMSTPIGTIVDPAMPTLVWKMAPVPPKLVYTLQHPPKPKVQHPVTSVTSAPSGSVWDRLAACESGGNWHTNTGNGYGGGIQFSPATWRSVGGSGHPSQASREEQIKRGKILQARSGWSQWPACSRKLGLR